MWRLLAEYFRHGIRTKIIILLLLFSAGMMAIWLRSYLIHERFVWHVAADSWGIINCNGQLQVRKMQDIHLQAGYRRLKGFWKGDESGNWESDNAVIEDSRIFGLGWYNGDIPFQGTGPKLVPRFMFQYRAFALPHRLVVILLLIPAFALLMPDVRRFLG
jgi:hypothetical protein